MMSILNIEPSEIFRKVFSVEIAFGVFASNQLAVDNQDLLNIQLVGDVEDKKNVNGAGSLYSYLSQVNKSQISGCITYSVLAGDYEVCTKMGRVKSTMLTGNIQNKFGKHLFTNMN